jgi:tRNA A-37 threonylcarbamoyl transferase component Bud32
MNEDGSPRASNVAALLPLVADRYQLTRRIATGGMGTVWVAEDLVLGREVAVKILREDLVESEQFLERFRTEARHTAALVHIGIAGVYDYGEERIGESLRAYLVMELVRGEALSDVLVDRGVFDVATTLSVIAQAADALEAAHASGVIHRDVKPANLMVLADGSVKLTDFGIARAIDDVALTEAGQIVGTAQYLSPEQAVGGDLTPLSDVYSLGVIAYQMVSGSPPFTVGNPAALAYAHVHQEPPPLPLTVPAGVRGLIMGALAKDPALRPADAHAFAVEARTLLANLTAATSSAATIDPVEPAAALTAETVVMGAAGSGQTAVMPTGGVAVGAPQVVIAPSALRGRRRPPRALALIGLAAIVLIAAGVAASRSSDTPFQVPTQETATTVAPPAPTAPITSAAPVVAVATTIASIVTPPPPTTPAPTPPATPAANGGKGKGGKGKGPKG